MCLLIRDDLYFNFLNAFCGGGLFSIHSLKVQGWALEQNSNTEYVFICIAKLNFWSHQIFLRVEPVSGFR